MDRRERDKSFSPDVHEFLAEIGEALRDHLEQMHQERSKILPIPMDGEGDDESGRVFPSQQ